MQLRKSSTRKNDFIPASESRLFTALFAWLAKQMARVHFHRVWIRQQYHPSPGRRTVYYLNHTSWWDGLIPLLLNRYRFNQAARAMMEDRQMVRYRFFKRLGAFSVSLEDTGHALRSLRYAVQSMNRPGSSLFIYPEGTIVPFSKQPEFRGGVEWICRQLSPEVDIVPVGIYIHTIRSSRPELHIHVGTPSAVSAPSLDLMHDRLHSILDDLEQNAGFRDEPYEPWI